VSNPALTALNAAHSSAASAAVVVDVPATPSRLEVED